MLRSRLDTRARAIALAITLASLAVGAAATAACKSDDSTPAPAVTPDASVAETGGPEPEAGPTTTLYERLGKRAGIAKAVDAIVTETLKDPEIASYFFYQSGAPANGHPTADQIKSCLVFQIASATGGTETYPPAASETGGFTCRTMVDAHANLHIPNSVFFKFVTTAATVLLGLGVSNDDASTVAGFLDAYQSVIVDPARDGGSFVPPGDGGDAGDAAPADGGGD